MIKVPTSRPPVGATLAAMLMMMPATAEACIDIAPFKVEDIQRADVVLTGELIDYEVLTGPRDYSLNKYGLLTFRVDGVLRGKVAPEVQLYWWNSTFGMPEEMDEGERMIVAAVDTEKPLPLRVASGYVQGSMRPELLSIMQAPCSAPFIFPYDETTAENIRSVLQGEDPGAYDYFRSSERQATRKRTDGLLASSWHSVALLLLLVLSALGMVMVSRRRQRSAPDPDRMKK